MSEELEIITNKDGVNMLGQIVTGLVKNTISISKATAEQLAIFYNKFVKLPRTSEGAKFLDK